MFYATVYENLCERGRLRAREYSRGGSGLHAHRVVPRHSGGVDAEENFTYVTPREHVVAHFLLWKINRNPNDLRSMKLLGAELTLEQRRLVGRWCFDNKIGIHSYSREEKKTIALRGVATQKSRQVGIFNPETRSKFAAIGGRAGSRAQIEQKVAIFNPKMKSFWARLGGLAVASLTRERIKKAMKEKTGIFSEESIKKARAGASAAARKSRGWKFVNDGSSCKKVDPATAESLVKAGWSLGMPPGKGNRLGKRSHSRFRNLILTGVSG